jgi:ligand-binding sensor domain-containing protein
VESVAIYVPIVMRLAVLSCLLTTLLGAKHLPVRTYTIADGLPRNYIQCIVRDSRGFLWFCTPSGLSRFDGYQFTSYGQDEGLTHPHVNAILETSSGNYWVATSGGLCRFMPRVAAASKSRFTCYSPGETHWAGVVNAIFEGSGGTIWVGTDGGLYQFSEPESVANPPRFHFIDLGMSAAVEGRTAVTALLEDRHGALWVGTEDSGLYRRWADAYTARYTTRQGLPVNHILSLAEDPHGSVWVGTWFGLVQASSDPDRRQGLKLRVYGKKDGIKAPMVVSVLFSPDGQLWVATPGGLSGWTSPAARSGAQFETWTTSQGLAIDGILTVAQDAEGNLWLGTSGAGAMRIARGGFRTYTTADGLGGDSVSSIFEDAEGSLIAIASPYPHRGFLNVRKGDRFISFQPQLPTDFVHGWGWNQMVVEDRAREWWIPSGYGVYRFPGVASTLRLVGAHAKTVYLHEKNPQHAIFRLFEDSRGDIWAATQSATGVNGLVRWDRRTGAVIEYSEREGLPPSPKLGLASAFREDSSGNLWVGFHVGGLARYRQGRFTLFTEADGVPKGFIGDLHLDAAGRLWVASGVGGLGWIDQPAAEHLRIQVYTTAQGLSSNAVRCITEDKWGRIYAGTGRGVDRIDPWTGAVRWYSAADGLPVGEMNAAYCDRQGVLWFGTMLGLARLTPEPDRPRVEEPILISGLHVRGVPSPISDLGESQLSGLVFGPNQNQFQFQFLGLTFASGQTLRYQYRLEGADRDWSAPTLERTVNYTSVSPGKYRFLVRALNSDGIASRQPAMVAFEVMSPIWQRWWFLLGLGLAICGALVALYQYRVRHLLAMERLRNRIAADLHDDIGSSLTQISILSEVGRRDSRPSIFSEIGGIARDMVAEMSEIVWAITPRHDRFEDLVHRLRRFAGDVLGGAEIELRFETKSLPAGLKVPLDARRPLYLIFKEAVNNVARHSGARTATIVLEVDQNILKLTVEDDGRGFDSDKKYPGEGLSNIVRRMKEIGGSAGWDAQPGGGTRFIGSLPLAARMKLHRLVGSSRRAGR